MIPTRLNSESRKLQAISAKATKHSKTVQGKKVKEPLEPSFTESFDSSPKAADDEYLNVFNKGSYKNMIEKHLLSLLTEPNLQSVLTNLIKFASTASV